jgi:hypothetical protein
MSWIKVDNKKLKRTCLIIQKPLGEASLRVVAGSKPQFLFPFHPLAAKKKKKKKVAKSFPLWLKFGSGPYQVSSLTGTGSTIVGQNF